MFLSMSPVELIYGLKRLVGYPREGRFMAFLSLQYSALF